MPYIVHDTSAESYPIRDVADMFTIRESRGQQNQNVDIQIVSTVSANVCLHMCAPTRGYENIYKRGAVAKHPDKACLGRLTLLF